LNGTCRHQHSHRYRLGDAANEYRECYDKARTSDYADWLRSRVHRGPEPELQLAALKRASCKRIFTDKVSGAKADRPGLRETLSHLRETDTLVVWKLDRLGRSVKELVDLVNELQERHVHFKSLTDGIETKTPAGRFFFHVMASLAQMERELIIERARAGLEAAKRQGRVGGRKRRMTEGKVKAARKLLSSGYATKRCGPKFGCVGANVIPLGPRLYENVGAI
jgi:DNA invertase Pin-like site-specific DNA recombinase